MIKKIAVIAVMAMMHCYSVFAAVKTGVIVDAGFIFTTSESA